jgi:hypothetical protein
VRNVQPETITGSYTRHTPRRPYQKAVPYAYAWKTWVINMLTLRRRAQGANLSLAKVGTTFSFCTLSSIYFITKLFSQQHSSYFSY